MKKQILILIGVSTVMIIFFFFTSYTGSDSRVLFETEELFIEEEEYINGVEDEAFNQSLHEKVFVDVQGEVANPNVFEVDGNVRIGYLIYLAGGLTNYANVRGLNQAARVYDEMVIFVPHVDDASKTEIGSIDEVFGVDHSGLISLSTASASKLQSLPGIGVTISANIIAHRDEFGAFSTVDELINVAGIGTTTLENVRKLVKP